MLVRFLLSIASIIIFGCLNAAWNATATIEKARLAGLQFEDSDSSAIMSQTGMHMIGSGSVSLIVLLAILLAIWFVPLRRAFTVMILAGLLGSITAPAFAYYDKYDYNESIYVLPNQSAFWIPDTGANKESQSQFGSSDYLASNKIASKRFTIPHTKLTNSGVLSDYYVPSGRLIVVDRTPYSREWNASSTRGSSKNDESFSFESADSLNISTAIVISAFVAEEDAAKFLYWFGTKPVQIDQSNPASQFQSVIYGNSLADVMDSTVRRDVQTILANQFGGYMLRDGITKKREIMLEVQKQLRADYAPKGITISFVGYGESLTFDPPVQAAINNAYIATKEAERAIALAPAIPVLQAQTHMDAERTIAAKWNGSLPNWMLLPSDLINMVTGWFHSDPQKVADARPAGR